ncbi:uncharacterized protein HMPREF1541_00044 [Cyphellophora europaea CBS 101466]|uniref:Zn(2)-C6 fungal-type domain-containing protein n=1 Tax=Cyphellophora europaea (strain CBS 101466) TaxID=1220924 RepID=W2SCY8_CYPE1|nr:uncharacterized protein HMPREF1541_00044 [Cyphellophora europaea CBS 101466]ETN45863.1 hypothetical protein HMPREF1541_00044 [Cyphellophora europaea CBS 101466]
MSSRDLFWLSPSTSESTISTTTTTTAPVPKRRLTPNQTRRAHTKSRTGCTTCKRRKVKCTEDRPTCLACQQRHTPCSYRDPDPNPTTNPGHAHDHHNPGRTLPSRRTATTDRRILPLPSSPDSPSDLNLTDLRLHHHFLATCYPHLPAGNEAIWLREIPVLGTQRAYLMHALLGLAATHLQLLAHYRGDRVVREGGGGGGGLDAKAIHHRTHALAGLHGALQEVPVPPPPSSAQGGGLVEGGGNCWSQAHATALLACAYALTFQATYMPDGLEEFVTMVRGCALITGQIGERGFESFFDLREGAHVDVMEGRWGRGGDGGVGIGGLDKGWVDSGRRGLGRVRAWMEEKGMDGHLGEGVEWRFIRAVEEAMEGCEEGVREGYVRFCAVYRVWFECDGMEFGKLVDKDNEVCRVLMAYFMGMELLLAPVFGGRYESEKRRRDVIGLRILCSSEWVTRISDGLGESGRDLIRWPLEVSKIVGHGARRWVIEDGMEAAYLEAAVWHSVDASEPGDAGLGRGHANDYIYPTPEGK